MSNTLLRSRSSTGVSRSKRTVASPFSLRREATAALRGLSRLEPDPWANMTTPTAGSGVETIPGSWASVSSMSTSRVSMPPASSLPPGNTRPDGRSVLLGFLVDVDGEDPVLPACLELRLVVLTIELDHHLRRVVSFLLLGRVAAASEPRWPARRCRSRRAGSRTRRACRTSATLPQGRWSWWSSVAGWWSSSWSVPGSYWSSSASISGVDSVVPTTLVVLVGIVDGVEGGAEGRVVDVVVVPSSATTVVDTARLVVAVRTGDGASVTCPRTLPTAAEAISTDTAVTVNHAAMSPRFLFTRP